MIKGEIEEMEGNNSWGNKGGLRLGGLRREGEKTNRFKSSDFLVGDASAKRSHVVDCQTPAVRLGVLVDADKVGLLRDEFVGTVLGGLEVERGGPVVGKVFGVGAGRAC